MAYRGDDWQRWPLHAEVTNGTEFGRIERASFADPKTGVHDPMVRILGGPRHWKRVRPWQKPRWVVMSESESERAHATREDARMSADLAADTGDNRTTRDGKRLPKWSPEFRRKLPRVRENATAEQRAAIDRHRGDDGDSPF